MGIDRWKQEHRNWRPSGVTLVASEVPPDEPSSAAPSLVPGEKTIAKPIAAKKQAASTSANRSSDKAQPKRSKR